MDVVEHSQLHLYADDSQLYVHTLPTVDGVLDASAKLNQDLMAIKDWSLKHSLVLNPKKSVFITLGTKNQVQKIKNANPVIKVFDTIVPSESCVRNLGLLLDENLRFEQHVRNKMGKCFGALRKLYHFQGFLKREIRLLLCNSLVLSHLTYCDIVYAPCLLKKPQIWCRGCRTHTCDTAFISPEDNI